MQREHHPAGISVGFDLDMTLIDSRRSVGAALCALSNDTGRSIEIADIVDHLGPPISELLEPFFGPHELDTAVDCYIDHYLTVGVPLTKALPGAVAAVEAVRARPGRAIVVTAKHPRTALRSLEFVGMTVDAVYPSRHGSQKRESLVAEGVDVYVGDTPSDMRAALEAGCDAIGVASGAFTTDELVAAGAHLVLASLLELPRYLAERGG